MLIDTLRTSKISCFATLAVFLPVYCLSQEAEHRTYECVLQSGLSTTSLPSNCTVNFEAGADDLVVLAGKLKGAPTADLQSFLATFDTGGELGLLVGAGVFELDLGPITISNKINELTDFAAGTVIDWGEGRYKILFQ